MRLCLCFLYFMFFATLPAQAQQDVEVEEDVTTTDQSIDVEAEPDDKRVARRIADILQATDWYEMVEVRADDGIVFLDGLTNSAERRIWATDLAAKTTGVVAVVNRIEVQAEVKLTLDPAVREVRQLKDQVLAALPSILLAIVILPLAWIIAGLVRRSLRWALSSEKHSPFVTDLIARLGALPIFLLGLYLVLQIAGLTQLAVSIVGGAGVLGIVIGFAFRDIAENFLASLLLSLRQPFKRGDFINVAGQNGIVHSMNTRSTVLVSPEGNHIQIPNATVFKSIIENLTAVPRRRGLLEVGIGYDAAISDAQKIISTVLSEQDSVLADPEPMVLADSLGASTVNVKIYYWFDGDAISPLKLRSALIRKIKQALTDAGISLPDEAREIVFPEGIPLQSADQQAPSAPAPSEKPAPREAHISVEEGDLHSDFEALADQMDAQIEGEPEQDLLTVEQSKAES